MRRNGFLTFCCALVPGCGQMYQGYMKRGVSLLFWFGLFIALTEFSHMDPLWFLPMVLFAYSFFDTFNLRQLSAEQRAVFQDNYIPNPKWLQGGADFEVFSRNLRFSKVAGWGFIVVGGLILLNNFYRILLSVLYDFNDQLAYWVDFAGGTAVALLIGAAVILIGLRLLKGPKKNETEKLEEYKGDGNG